MPHIPLLVDRIDGKDQEPMFISRCLQVSNNLISLFEWVSPLSLEFCSFSPTNVGFSFRLCFELFNGTKRQGVLDNITSQVAIRIVFFRADESRA